MFNYCISKRGAGNMKAFKVKRLYDGNLGAYFDNCVVVINGEHVEEILSLNEFETYKIYNNVDLLDYSQYYMMPGLIDCHVHLMIPGNNTLGEYIANEWSDGEINIMAYRNAMEALRNGVTSMRDCGSINYAAINVRKAIANQNIIGPDILSCGAPLTCTGGHCHYMGGEADGPWEIRKKIRQQQKAGADFVKLMGTYGGTIGITKNLTFSDEELMAAVDEAHLRELKIAVHSCTFEMTEKLSKIGVDTIEHAVMCPSDCSKNILDEETANRMASKNIYATYTMCCVKGEISRLEKLINSNLATESDKKAYESNVNYDNLINESFIFQMERNVPYVIGTDAGWRAADFKSSFYDNIYVMEKDGAKSIDLIHASTLRGAKALGIDSKTGSIEKSKYADILLLKKDPADSLAEAIKKPDVVIKKGNFVVEKALNLTLNY